MFPDPFDPRLDPPNEPLAEPAPEKPATPIVPAVPSDSTQPLDKFRGWGRGRQLPH